MGAQQVKERSGGAGAGTIGTGGSIGGLSGGGTASALGAGSSIRSSRNKPRVPKDSRILGSNIFTEHSGIPPSSSKADFPLCVRSRQATTSGFRFCAVRTTTGVRTPTKTPRRVAVWCAFVSFVCRPARKGFAKEGLCVSRNFHGMAKGWEGELV
ncbi:hypothetical protein quinque_003292 [Culex quinquefasciatus]